MVVAESAPDPDPQYIQGIKNLHIFVSYKLNLVNVFEFLS